MMGPPQIKFSSLFNYTEHPNGKFNVDVISWDVSDFKNLLNQQVPLMTPEKSDDPTARFKLKIHYPCRKNDIFEIYHMSPNPVYLKCNLTIESPTLFTNNAKILVKIEKEYHMLEANQWQYSGTVVKCAVDTNSNIRIKCEFQYQLFSEDIVDHYKIPEAHLSSDFANLLDNGLYSDVTMKSADGIEYKVHKVVLASRSAVLKAHFEHNTTECHSNTIESPLDADVLREVLTFIYSDEAPRVDQLPEKLLVAADYYQLNMLKSLCENRLYKKLNIENAMDILQCADLFSANTLKQITLEFIKDHWKSITKTEGWAKVKSIDLIKGICEYITIDDVCDRVKAAATKFRSGTEGERQEAEEI